jgi:hypothetical protein
MKKIVFFLFVFLVCSPNKPIPAIQTSVNSISACLNDTNSSLAKKSDSINIDSLGRLDSLRHVRYLADFDTAFANYQSKDSLRFYFFVCPPCDIDIFNITPFLLDTETMKVDISYQGVGSLCDCKRKFDVSMHSDTEDLSHVKYIRFNRAIFGTTPKFFSGDTTIPLVVR